MRLVRYSVAAVGMSTLFLGLVVAYAVVGPMPERGGRRRRMDHRRHQELEAPMPKRPPYIEGAVVAAVLLYLGLIVVGAITAVETPVAPVAMRAH